MPGNEQLGNQPIGPDPEQEAAQAAAAGQIPEADMLSDAAAGYDPVAEAEAAMADAAARAGDAGPEIPGADPGEPGGPGAGPDAFQPDGAEGGPSRLMGALRTAGSALGEAARWTAPVVGTAVREESGVDLYKFAGEQPELNEDQQFAAGVARWAMRRGMEHLAERQGART